jgi:hypothetical protein
MLASKESCTPAQPIQIAASPAAPPTFTLDHQTYVPTEAIEIHFNAPLASPDGSRAWITAVEAGAAPTSYGSWEYVEDHARTATIKAPDKPGKYELRLHTDYPKLSTNMRFAVGFTVADQTAPAQPAAGVTPPSRQRFSLGSAQVRKGSPVEVRFAQPMVAQKGEQFWITIVEHSKPDTEYGAWQYLPPGARAISLTAPATAGDYDVRLHGNYPTKSTNVVFRSALSVY